jgi:hypothetical protein
VEPGDGAESFRVSGRGTLHLGILIENMRREGYEFEIGPPKVGLVAGVGKRQGALELWACAPAETQASHPTPFVCVALCKPHPCPWLPTTLVYPPLSRSSPRRLTARRVSPMRRPSWRWAGQGAGSWGQGAGGRGQGAGGSRDPVRPSQQGNAAARRAGALGACVLGPHSIAAWGFSSCCPVDDVYPTRALARPQVPETYVGSVVELFAQRKGEMVDMQPSLEVRRASRGSDGRPKPGCPAAA